MKRLFKEVDREYSGLVRKRGIQNRMGMGDMGKNKNMVMKKVIIKCYLKN